MTNRYSFPTVEPEPMDQGDEDTVVTDNGSNKTSKTDRSVISYVLRFRSSAKTNDDRVVQLGHPWNCGKETLQHETFYNEARTRTSPGGILSLEIQEFLP